MTISDGNGARWVRAALQVNPYEYKGASSPQRMFDDEESYNNAILNKCEAERIELIAITDHWAINSALGLVKAAAERGITALPGFEANTSEGIHLLVIFERDTPFEQISAAIGQCGRDISPGCASGTTGDSFADIVDNMTARGALVIPAHVNTSPRGMLTVFSGQPLAGLIRHDHIHALAVSPAYDDAPDQANVLAGRAPFDRDHPLGDDLRRRHLASRSAGGRGWVMLVQDEHPGPCRPAACRPHPRDPHQVLGSCVSTTSAP